MLLALMLNIMGLVSRSLARLFLGNSQENYRASGDALDEIDDDTYVVQPCKLGYMTWVVCLP